MNTNGTDVLTESCNCIMMLYLDGGSFSGNVADPVPVPGQPGKFVHYKGLRNLDATLDHAFAHLGARLQFRPHPPFDYLGFSGVSNS